MMRKINLLGFKNLGLNLVLLFPIIGGRSRRSPLAGMLLLALALALSACGGGGGDGGTPAPDPGAVDSTAPTATYTPGGGLLLADGTAIVIVFSESMDTTSLTVGGGLSGESDGGAWSTGSATDDTLTVSPTGTWTDGTNRTLTVAADDGAGNALATLNLTFTVAAGGRYYVSAAEADDTGDGLTPATAKKTINAAITLAGGGVLPAVVLVAEGTHTVDSGGATHVVMVEGVSLFGGFNAAFTARDTAATPSIITDTATTGGSANNPPRAVEAGSAITAATVIDGFVLTGTSSHTFGAAMWAGAGGAPTIRNNTINGGAAGDSYGVSLNASSPTITGNTINGGAGASRSHGIFLYITSSPTISGNIIDGGTSGEAYGISAYTNSDATISGNTINGGASATSTWGVYVNASSPTISNNTINGGDGTSIARGIQVVTTSTVAISSNTVFAGGADGVSSSARGIECDNSTATVTSNALISGGKATNATTAIDFATCAGSTITGNTINGGDASAGSASLGMLINASDPTIDNNTINGGTGASNATALRLASSPLATITNNTINGGTTVTANDTVGISVEGTGSGPTISNNTSINGGTAFRNTYAIFIKNSAAPTISNNPNINGGTGGTHTNGIVDGSTGNATITGNTVNGGNANNNSTGIVSTGGLSIFSGNTVRGGGVANSSYGIKVSTAATVSDNTVYGGGGTNLSVGIENINGSAATIERNTISGGSGGSSYGVNIAKSTILHNNLISGDSGPNNSIGVNISAGAPLIRNNTIAFDSAAAFTSAGIRMSITGTPAIENNIIFSTGGGAGTCIKEEAIGSDPTAVNNNDLDCSILYHDNDSNGGAGSDMTVICAGGKPAEAGCGVLLTTPIPSANITIDPSLADVAGLDGDVQTMGDNDWHLSAFTPPSVSAGGLNGNDIGTWVFTDDFDLVTRPVAGAPGALWAMGAYEP